MKRFFGLRGRLIILVALATIPSLVFIGYSASRERQAAIYAAESDVLRLAQLAAQAQARVIYGAREVLVTISELKEVREADAAAASAALKKLLPNYRFYANLGLASPDGVVTSSALPMGDPVSVADRIWFKEAIRTRDLRDVSRISSPSKRCLAPRPASSRN